MPAKSKTEEPRDAHEAIELLVGGIRTFLRSHDTTEEHYAECLNQRYRCPDYIDFRAEAKKDPAEQTDGYKEWLGTELRVAITASSREFARQYDKRGNCYDNPDAILRLSKKAWRADLGTTFVKGLYSNAIAYGLVSVASLAIGIPLGFFLGPVPMIVATLAMSVIGTYKWAVHALPAGGAVSNALDESKREALPKQQGQRADPQRTRSAPEQAQQDNPSKHEDKPFNRQRFSRRNKYCKPKKATMRELRADLVARSGPRLAITGPLYVTATALNLTHVAVAFASILSAFIIGPLSGFIGPPTNAAMQVVSQIYNARHGGRTMAPLAGIAFDAKEGRIYFEEGRVASNVERLSKPTRERIVGTCGRLASEYRQRFPAAVAKEKAQGMTNDITGKAFELGFGGNTIGPAFSAALGYTGVCLGGLAEPILKGLIAPLASRACGPTNVWTRADTQANSEAIQNAKKHGFAGAMRQAIFESSPGKVPVTVRKEFAPAPQSASPITSIMARTPETVVTGSNRRPLSTKEERRPPVTPARGPRH